MLNVLERMAQEIGVNHRLVQAAVAVELLSCFDQHDNFELVLPELRPKLHAHMVLSLREDLTHETRPLLRRMYYEYGVNTVDFLGMSNNSDILYALGISLTYRQRIKKEVIKKLIDFVDSVGLEKHKSWIPLTNPSHVESYLYWRSEIYHFPIESDDIDELVVEFSSPVGGEFSATVWDKVSVICKRGGYSVLGAVRMGGEISVSKFLGRLILKRVRRAFGARWPTFFSTPLGQVFEAPVAAMLVILAAVALEELRSGTAEAKVASVVSGIANRALTGYTEEVTDTLILELWPIIKQLGSSFEMEGIQILEEA